MRLVLASATRVDPAARRVTLDDGSALAFDLCSLDVGAAAAGLADTPGAAAHAHALRPIAGVHALLAALGRLAAGDAPATACVVGGGAAGLEVALAVEAALRRGGRRPAVALVERGAELLPTYSARVRRLARAALAERGVAVHLDASVATVDADAVRLDDGRVVPSACTVWVAGAAAPPVVADSPLPRNADGFLRVDATLRAVDGSPVWGAGDCVALDDAPWVPKAGVYAVRQGPVLADNLRAALDGTPPRRYRPQRATLSLLATGDRRAVLAWRGVAAEGAWPYRLKEWIDLRWLRRYAASASPASGHGAGRPPAV
jgi:selenide,water dikinase